MVAVVQVALYGLAIAFTSSAAASVRWWTDSIVGLLLGLITE